MRIVVPHCPVSPHRDWNSDLQSSTWGGSLDERTKNIWCCRIPWNGLLSLRFAGGFRIDQGLSTALPETRWRERPGPLTTGRHGIDFLELNIAWRFQETSEQGQATEGLVNNSGFLSTIQRVIERTEPLGIRLSGFEINWDCQKISDSELKFTLKWLRTRDSLDDYDLSVFLDDILRQGLERGRNTIFDRGILDCFSHFPLFAPIAIPPSSQNVWSLRRAGISTDPIHSSYFAWDFKASFYFYYEFLGYDPVVRELSRDQWSSQLRGTVGWKTTRWCRTDLFFRIQAESQFLEQKVQWEIWASLGDWIYFCDMGLCLTGSKNGLNSKQVWIHA
jgi:hypothetical protein